MGRQSQLRFESRELKPYADVVPVAALERGALYFSVSFVDRDALVPILQPLVFLGRDMRGGDEAGWLYFQDFESYARGVKFGEAQGDGPPAKYVRCPENAMINVHEFETALDELLLCSLRRRGLAP